MSARISTSTEQSTASQASRSAGDKLVKPSGPKAFDATKVAVNSQISEQPVVDSFSRAIEEAMDNDSLRRNAGNDTEDDERKANGDFLDRVRQGKTEGASPNQDSKEGDSQTKSEQKARATQAANEAEKTDSQTEAKAKKPDATKSHQQLMLLSATMDKNQTASHVAQASARKVQSILTGDLWMRDSSRNKNLKIAQILRVS